MPGPSYDSNSSDATTSETPTESTDRDDSSNILDLSSKNLSHLALSRKDYQFTTVLNLNYNNLTCLPVDITDHIPKLRKLCLIGNELSQLPNTIGKLSELQEITASENKIMHLPDSLRQLTKLQVLDLVGNKISELIPDIGCLKMLEKLDVEENCITSLPESFGQLESLQIFEACCNKLTELSQNFGKLKRLQVLNLSNNKLERLPESFADLPSLEILDLSDNQIEYLPSLFNSAAKLEKVYVVSNSLRSLPAWIGNMPNIKELSLRDNQLSHGPFSDNFGPTSIHLKDFDISGNFIESLPGTLGRLQALQKLHFGSVIGELERRNFQNGNWIPRLPESFGDLINLTELHADENQLEELPENFGQLLNLVFLDVGQNRLTKLPDSFCLLVSLRVCKLSKNGLKCLPDEFGNLRNIVDLRLDTNKIRELPVSVAHLTELVTLDLFDNHLQGIPDFLQNFKKLERLDLDENDFYRRNIDEYYKVPYLTQNNKYPDRDPGKADNWRGRARQDNVIADMKQFLKDTNASISSNLLKAMENSRSIWETHEGSKTTRQKPSRSGAVDGKEQLHTLTEKKLCIETEANEDDDAVGSRGRTTMPQFHYTSSEDDGSEYSTKSIDSDRPSVIDSNTSPVPSPSNVSNEDWETELDDSPPYDMIPVAYKHPANIKRFIFDSRPNFEYIPSVDHVPSVPTNTEDFDVENGQFDDA